MATPAGYRLFRDPLVMFGRGPLYALLVQPRLVSRSPRPRIRRSVMATNIALAALVGALCWPVGWRDYLLVQMPSALIAGSASVWLFHVQHISEQTPDRHCSRRARDIDFGLRGVETRAATASAGRQRETIMRVGLVLPILAVGAVCGAGAALAAHPQVDPNTVPVGFLTAHSTVNKIPASSIAAAFRSGKADVFIEHARLAPNQVGDFHTHPGPSFITVQRGSLRYEEATGGRCLRKNFGQSRGFVDGPSRHPHRVVAGASGVDYYEVYLLPRRTGPHFTKVSTPAECGSHEGALSPNSSRSSRAY